jgi:hypothetical protein
MAKRQADKIFLIHINKNYKNITKKIDLENVRLTAKGKNALNELLKKISPRLLEMRQEYPGLTDEILYKMAINRDYLIGYYEGFAHASTYFDRAIAIYKDTSEEIKRLSAK